jgi:hypothetical protein
MRYKYCILRNTLKILFSPPQKQAVTQYAKNTGGEDDRGGAAARAD